MYMYKNNTPFSKRGVIILLKPYFWTNMEQQTNIIIPDYKGHIINQRKEDGYINITPLSKIYGKQVSDWTRLKITNKYIHEVSSITGISEDLLIEVKQGGPNENQGTWVHLLLALDFCRWISVELSVWINNCILGQYYNLTMPTKSKESSGFVYLINQESTDFYKIGASKDVYNRISHLQIASPLPLKVVHRIFSLNNVRLEHTLHKYFNDYKVMTEWFNLPKDLVDSFLVIANKLDMDNEETHLKTFNLSM